MMKTAFSEKGQENDDETDERYDPCGVYSSEFSSSAILLHLEMETTLVYLLYKAENKRRK